MSKLLKEWNRLAFSKGSNSLHENANAGVLPITEESMSRYFFPYPGPMGVSDWKEWIEDACLQASKAYVLIEYTEDSFDNPNSFYSEIQDWLREEFTGDGIFDLSKHRWNAVKVHDPDEPIPEAPTHLRWMIR